jgi:HK97 family phage portal protein
MGLLASLLGPRAEGLNPLDDRYYDTPSVRSVAGIDVSPATALAIGAVFACVRVRAETVGMLPLQLYRQTGRTKEIARDHEWYRLLHTQPNPWQTSAEFRQMAQGHVDMRGNFYAYKQYGVTGPQALIPMDPDRMGVERLKDNTLRYSYREQNGTSTPYMQDEIFHLRGLSVNGLTGLSVVGVMREVFGGALATQDFANRLWSQGALMRGYLSTEKKLGPEGRKALRASFEEAATGASNHHRTPVFEEGLTFNALSMLPEDAQFLETRKYQRAEIAGLFRVPAHMINDLERATFSNIEELGLEFVKYNMMPAFIMWEGCINTQLIGPDEPDVYAKVSVGGLLRGDSASRAEFYKSGIETGWLTRNEVREYEDLDAIEGLDEPLVPNSNAVPAGQSGPPASARARMIVLQAAARVVRKEQATIRRYAPDFEANADGWAGWLAQFYGKHAEMVSETLDLGPATARDYCERQRAAVLAGGIGVLEAWETDVTPALARLALGEE